MVSTDSKIFISYRRQDTGEITPHLSTRLENFFQANCVFVDTDEMVAGDDFRDQIREAIESCSVMLVMIGPGWIDVTSDSGVKRLEDDNDYVRIEIETAIELGVKIVPVLVNGANMPSEAELPDSIGKLSFLHAEDIRSGRLFSSDTNRIVQLLLSLGIPGPKAPPPFEYALFFFGAFLVLGAIGIVFPQGIIDPWNNRPYVEEDYGVNLSAAMIGGPLFYGFGVLLICCGGRWCCGRKAEQRRAQFIGSAYQPKPKSRNAIISVALGLSSAGFNLLTGVPAVVYGIRALAEIREAPSRWTGKWHAYHGIAFGVLGPILSILLLYLIWSANSPYRIADAAEDLFRSGQKDAAIEMLNDATAAYAWCSAPFKQRGQLYVADQKYSDAVNDFSTAIKLYEKFLNNDRFTSQRDREIISKTYLLRSEAREEAGDTDGAEQDSKKADDVFGDQ